MNVLLYIQKVKPIPFLLLVCAACGFVCRAGSADGLSVEEIAKHAEEATVLIGTLDSSQSVVGQGSGFFVSPNLIVTNFHVVKDKSVIMFQRFGQEEFNSIQRVRGVDRKHDLALLEVSTSSG